ncbi:DUF1003 domain-containing protein [Variovorax sp. KBW07]|uniref:DUF1003 domain-containing protein n=1 Tax=Variovorax sp. KBW07 TaxID=2153358 RepID=UPI000F56BB0F|nr:DUF1003 domain-containing protein [Variovorax sp. KBW07]RQO47743.1 DUF1003 domain-containing protein [Variovorax sp. KBW07]
MKDTREPNPTGNGAAAAAPLRQDGQHKHNGHHRHPSIEALTHRNIEAILKLEEDNRRSKPTLYKVVARMSRFCGTVAFLWWNLGLFALWIVLNQWVWKIDPYPFTFLLFLVSIEAIVLAIMILISQNMSDEENERRHHLDLQINLLNEREMTAMLRLVMRMAQKMELPPQSDEEVRALAERTDPGKVLHQIVDAEAAHGQGR